MPESDSQHPLYRAADMLLSRGMSRRQLLRLRKCFDRHGLPLPVDFSATLEEVGTPPTL